MTLFHCIVHFEHENIICEGYGGNRGAAFDSAVVNVLTHCVPREVMERAERLIDVIMGGKPSECHAMHATGVSVLVERAAKFTPVT